LSKLAESEVSDMIAEPGGIDRHRVLGQYKEILWITLVDLVCPLR
jgi:hypothetical protein